jgi:hypothetical protein
VRTTAPPLTKLLCLAIAHHLSNANKSWILKAKTLARETGMSERSITTHIEKAEKLGLLSASFVHDAKGHRSALKFTPAFPQSMSDLAASVADSDERLDANPALSASSLDASGADLAAGAAGRLPAGDAPQVSFPEYCFHSSFPKERAQGSSRRSAPRRQGIDPTAELDPDSEGMAFALQAGLSASEACEEFRKFKDHHNSKNNKFADIMAAWRNWVRRSIEFRTRSNGTARVSATDRARKAFMEG